MSKQQSESSLLSAVIASNQTQGPQGARVIRADISEINEDGTIRVVPVEEDAESFLCDILESAFSRDTRLETGDIVLVLTPSQDTENGCILGRVASYRPPEKAPDHLVLEAGEKLTLKCGDASLDLRKDGKLMILGQDVLTRAKRTQRIKGGSVAIN